jgi:hypothetical protein
MGITSLSTGYAGGGRKVNGIKKTTAAGAAMVFL